MNRLIWMAAVGVAMLMWSLPQARAAKEDPRWLLQVCQDESSLEKTIADYMKEEYDIQAGRHVTKQDDADIYLSYTLAPEGAPKIACIVDSEVSARNGDRVVERMIKIVAWYELPASAKTRQARAKILELNNEWHEKKWMPGRVYIDDDGDIRLETFLNIPSTTIPVHAELVRDLLVRTNAAWAEYYQTLAKSLSLPPP